MKILIKLSLSLTSTLLKINFSFFFHVAVNITFKNMYTVSEPIALDYNKGKTYIQFFSTKHVLYQPLNPFLKLFSYFSASYTNMYFLVRNSAKFLLSRFVTITQK